jgi:hypothetical protein
LQGAKFFKFLLQVDCGSWVVFAKASTEPLQQLG